VLALGAVGVVVLMRDDDKGSVGPAATVLATDGSPGTTATSSGDEVAGAPQGIEGDLDNPVPLGMIADIGNGWRLQILEVVPDGAPAVAGESDFNDPPPAGSTFTLVKVALGYFGLDEPTSAFRPYILPAGAPDPGVDSNCGQVPDQLNSFVDMFSGAVVVGNICFVTTTEQSTSLQLAATGGGSETDQVVLRANGPATTVDAMAALSGPQAGASATPSRLAPTALTTVTDVGAGWTMAVTGAARDITDLVEAENEFNEPPADGFRFIGMDVTYSYSGSDPTGAYVVSTKAVGDGNIELGTNCGDFPGLLDSSTDVEAGSSVAGTICFVVPSANPNIVVYASADFDTPPVMFAVV